MDSWKAGAGPDSVELLRSLRRVAAIVNSDLKLDSVLQTVVDAVCDLTLWQICWIDVVDVAANQAEVVARRDKLEYSAAGRQVRWLLDGIPALDAVTSGEPVVIADAQHQQRYAAYATDARHRGYVCGVVLPLSAQDVDGRPMVLCVQSDHQLTDDPHQLPFLRTVAELASLAVRNARQAAAAQAAMTTMARGQAMQASVLDALIRGQSSALVYDLVQSMTSESMTILDGDERVVYGGSSPDPGRYDTAAWAAIAGDVARAAVKAVALDEYEQAVPQSPVRIDAFDDQDVRIRITRIVDGTQALGTAVFLRTLTGSAETNHPPLSQLRSAVAAVLMRDLIRHQTEQDLGVGIIDPLLSGKWTRREDLLVRASSLGLPLEQPMHLIAVRAQPAPTASEWESLVRSLRVIVGQWQGALMVRAGAGLAVLVPAESAPEGQRLTQGLHTLRARAQQILGRQVTIGRAGPCVELEQYPRAWRECELAVELAEKLQQFGVVRLDDFGAYRFLLAASAAEDVDDFINKVIGKLLAYDREHRTQLLDTAERFVSCGGKYQETSVKLHVHVSTLRYRLDRVTELLGRDLNDEETRFELILATRLHRLRSAALSTPATGTLPPDERPAS
ncbi:helix-turn-helix domain-containing protein [Dactylosporangium fulvum]|uniref:Helix-turn-helix domain-containing protein n=1 Tax=Dactylosporangium fulvum TaxID=53359 RepID=A0ABY5W5K4_9ACTN|nr:helix-turn-helix domain-containing protein [Dactylosporangium fulvum]UWP85278.1 helix-turn-helix domain-containing protein [Dactylosporangium fulvum]